MSAPQQAEPRASSSTAICGLARGPSMEAAMAVNVRFAASVFVAVPLLCSSALAAPQIAPGTMSEDGRPPSTEALLACNTGGELLTVTGFGFGTDPLVVRASLLHATLPPLDCPVDPL